MKKSVVFLLCIVFVIGIIGSGLGGYFLGVYKEGHREDQAFDEPEDCILYFFEQLQEGDIEKVLSAFSPRFSGDNFDFEGYNERLNIVYFGMIPTNDKFFQEINQFEVKGRAISYIKGFIISLLLDSDLEDYPRINIDSTNEIEEIAEEFDFSRMEDIEVMEICKVKLEDERAIENCEKIASTYGHEFIEEYLVSFEFEQEMYAVGLTLYDDNGKFSIYSLSAMLMNTSSLGFARPMEKQSLTDLFPEDSELYSMEIIYEK